MVRPDKAAAVAELTDEFRSSQGAVLTEYRGLTVKQLQELRRALGENATYAVVKNTLTKIAAKEAGVEGFDDLLTGPSAIAFIKGDPVATAKSLRDFARTNSPLVIKGGILDGKLLTIGEIAKIADLESREVLLAKLAGALVASLQNAVSLFNAPLAQVARLAGALQANREQEEGPVVAEAAADEAPAEVAPVDEAPTETAPAEAAPVDEAPTETAPAEAAPVDEAPAEAAPAESASADVTADETPTADAPDAESVATAPEETPGA